MLKIWSILRPLEPSNLDNLVSKILKYPKSIIRYLLSSIPEYLDTFRIVVTIYDFFLEYYNIQGVPILSVSIFRGDRGPIGEHCLLLTFFDFNDLKFSKKIIFLLLIVRKY